MEVCWICEHLIRKYEDMAETIEGPCHLECLHDNEEDDEMVYK